MTEAALFPSLVIIWTALALIVLPILFFIPAKYGRYLIKAGLVHPGCLGLGHHGGTRSPHVYRHVPAWLACQQPGSLDIPPDVDEPLHPAYLHIPFQPEEKPAQDALADCVVGIPVQSGQWLPQRSLPL